MPELRRSQPPPVDNQIPLVTSELRSSAMMQEKRGYLKEALSTFDKRAAFAVCFAQSDVRLIACFSSFPPLLTVLDCLRVCSTSEALYCQEVIQHARWKKQMVKEMGKTFDLMPLPTQNCLLVTLSLFFFSQPPQAVFIPPPPPQRCTM